MLPLPKSDKTAYDDFVLPRGTFVLHDWATRFWDVFLVFLLFLVAYFELPTLERGAPTAPDPIYIVKKEKQIVLRETHSDSALHFPFVHAQSQGEHPTPFLQSLSKLAFKSRLTASEIPHSPDLLINFPDDIYGVGQYNVTPDIKSRLDNFLRSLKPYSEKVALVFIGHTDKRPVAGQKQIINSNFVLSSVRANRALEYALQQGFDPRWVAAQGVGEYVRQTRSLSIRIIERGIK